VAERKVTITLGVRDARAAEQAVLDGDAEAALEFVRRVVKPQVDAALRHG
jgi:hypothetical protein